MSGLNGAPIIFRDYLVDFRKKAEEGMETYESNIPLTLKPPL